MLNNKEIREALPHRYPFLLVDRITEVVPNERVVGYKHVTAGEPWVAGHFPEEPVFPGVLVIEVMAQIGAFLFWAPHKGENQLHGYLSGVDKIKFLRPMVPGDTLRVEAWFVVRIGHLAQVKVEVRVEGELVATGLIAYAFTG